MKTWRAILVLGLVFFAGIVLGVVGTRVVVRRLVQQAIEHPERVQVLIERNLTRKLRLDGEQALQLETILTDTHTELHALRAQYQPQAADIFRKADAKIIKLLTPEQLTRYEKFKAENPMLGRVMQSGP
jgi:hypothetical protein